MSGAIPRELAYKLRIEEPQTWVKGTRFRAYDLQKHRPIVLSICRLIPSSSETRSLLSTLERISSATVAGVVPVWDFGQLDDGRCYWTSPAFKPTFLNGRDWKSFAEQLGAYRVVLQILEAAHLLKLYHGDVDEDSLVTLSDRLAITDFGLFQARGDERAHDIVTATAIFERLSNKLPISNLTEYETFRSWFLRARDMKKHDEIALSLKQLPWQDIPDDSVLNELKLRIVNIPPRVSRSMPVLAETFRLLDGLRSLERFAVVHINHLLDDVLDLNELLVGTGAELVYIALPYSKTPPPSVSEYDLLSAEPIGREEFRLSANKRAIGTAMGLVQCVESMIEHAICTILKGKLWEGRKLVILEDGGYHYSVVARLIQEGSLSSDCIVGAVEQTMSGVLRYSAFGGKVAYPVLTCARSNIKIRLEAFFVGQRVVEELAMLMYEYGTFLSLRHVLVIGYGIVGRNVALSLARHHCRVSVYDNDPEMIAAALSEGFAVFEPPNGLWPDDISVVVGATGEPSYTVEMFKAFLKSSAKSLYLVSASSKKIEFSAILSILDSVVNGRSDDGSHSPWLVKMSVEELKMGFAYHLELQGCRKTINVVANGYPVNFFRGGFSLSSRMIDPVNAELLLLIDTLVMQRQPLANRLHILGHSRLDSLCMSESNLLELWYEANSLVWPADETLAWDAFRPHPAEARLRLRKLQDQMAPIK